MGRQFASEPAVESRTVPLFAGILRVCGRHRRHRLGGVARNEQLRPPHDEAGQADIHPRFAATRRICSRDNLHHPKWEIKKV